MHLESERLGLYDSIGRRNLLTKFPRSRETTCPRRSEGRCSSVGSMRLILHPTRDSKFGVG